MFQHRILYNNITYTISEININAAFIGEIYPKSSRRLSPVGIVFVEIKLLRKSKNTIIIIINIIN